MSERVIGGQQRTEDQEFEWSLRPGRLAEFIGQEAIKANLEILVRAAHGRNEPIEHILIAGPPGLGKTTLANIMANEMGVDIRTTSGPAIEHQGALASILTNLEDRDIFFIDEIHRLARPVEESLYPAMEDFKFDYVGGKGAGAQTIRLQLPRFTVIGATTRQGMLSAPLRDRFGAVYALYFYDADDLFQIVQRSARLLKVVIDDPGARVIATRARGTPRIANRLLRRVRDYAQVRAQGRIDEQVARDALAMLDVDELGLDAIDRRILRTIAEKYEGGPVGLETVAVSVSEDPETVEDVYEPFLMQLGFLARTPRGRVATKLAYDHLGLVKVTEQPHLF
ncbi:MAG: Holliday junction branch migration DNA helicase RuvB [Chloroflexi bacterium]|nr:MAG: Holliday junction branch migration DNA helicase RuvB [Chloroflexota bacterium]TMG37361.1 MAG: Holliday junction branch migration DNA helicase RuvB [Chloroflexota bacterium]